MIDNPKCQKYGDLVTVQYVDALEKENTGLRDHISKEEGALRDHIETLEKENEQLRESLKKIGSVFEYAHPDRFEPDIKDMVKEALFE